MVGRSCKRGRKFGGTPKSPVTGGTALLCDGAVGATGAGWAAGLFSRIGGDGREPDSSMAFPLLRTTLECRAHLCRLAVLRDWNFRPQVKHSRSRGGS